MQFFTNQTEIIWYQNPNILVERNNLLKFVPCSYYTLEENINAIIRFFIYFTLILIILGYKFSATLILILPCIITIILYPYLQLKMQQHINSKNHSTNEQMYNNIVPLYGDNNTNRNSKDSNNNNNNQSTPLLPTQNNPFINDMPGKNVYLGKPKIEIIANNNEQIVELYQNNISNDPNNIYKKNNSQRQFYTTPDRNYNGQFENFLFKLPPTFKEKHLENY